MKAEGHEIQLISPLEIKEKKKKQLYITFQMNFT